MAIDYRTEPEYWEYLDGAVHPKVSPRSVHARVQGALHAIIREQGRERGRAGTEWDMYLPDRGKKTKFIPDVAFWSFERLRAMSREERDGVARGAPDIAVEVLSPGDDAEYIAKKTALYLANGSLVVLLVDPRERAMRVIDADGETVLRRGEAFAHSALPWLRFDLREAFADLDIPEK